MLYESFNGVVLAEKEGRDIAACLGGRKAALLQNHGLLTVGGSVEEVSLDCYLSSILQSSRSSFGGNGCMLTFFSSNTGRLLVPLPREMLPQPTPSRSSGGVSRRETRGDWRRGSGVYLPHGGI